MTPEVKTKEEVMNSLEIAEKVFGKDFLELNEWESEICLAPELLQEARQTIEYYKQIFIDLASNNKTESEKKLILSGFDIPVTWGK